jgi:hypothetical protein
VRGVTLLSILASSNLLHADSKADVAIAQALFEEGRTLMSERRYDEACDKFLESHRLDPASGTLVNLAVCHEKQGKTATAWAEYNDVVAASRREGNSERQRIASERIHELEPKLCRLTVVSIGDPSTRDIAIKVDGLALRSAAIGTAVPLDPGVHVVEISEPTRVLWLGRVTLPVEGASSTLTILNLQPTPVAAVADASTRDNRLAYVFGGTGAVSLGLGIFFGLRAKSEWDERNDHCASGSCDARAVAAARNARDLALAADAGFGLGLLGLGVATYMLLAPQSKPSKPAASVGIRLDSGAYVSAGGVF